MRTLRAAAAAWALASPVAARAGDAPRPIAPLAGSQMTSQRPALRWTSGAGDGYADVVYSFLPDASGEQNYELRWAHGGVRGLRLDQTPLPLPPPPAGEATSGYLFVGGAGDVDGDGYDDLFVFAEAEGPLALLAGGPRGPTRRLQTLALPARITAVDAIGDVNGDGFADVRIEVAGREKAGAAALYLGGARGLTRWTKK